MLKSDVKRQKRLRFWNFPSVSMIFGIDDTVLPNEPHDTDLTYTMALKIYRKCADVYCMRNSVGKEMYCMHLQVKTELSMALH